MSTINVGWRKILRSIFVLFVLALAALGGRFMHARLKAQQERLGGPIPYTVTLRSVVHKPDGSATDGFDLIWAVRSDGSTVNRTVHKERIEYVGQTQKKVAEAQVERTIHFASGTTVVFNELANTKTSTLAGNVNPAAWQRDPDSMCINSFAGKPMISTAEKIVGQETVAGYRTVKIMSNNLTGWYALDYGCAMVKDNWDFGGKESTEKYLISLVGGEPEAGLFDVPAVAREVSPSERLMGSSGECATCDLHAIEVLHKLDKDYEAHRAIKP